MRIAILVVACLLYAVSAQADATAISGQGQQQGQTQVNGQGVAEAFAQQGQTQGQGQAQGVNMSNFGNSGVSFSNSFNGSQPIRYLPDPSAVMVTTRGGPSLFGRPDYEDKGPNFVDMQKVVHMLNMIDLEDAEIADDGDIEAVVQMINAADEELTGEFKPEFSIINGVPFSGSVIAIVTLHADDNDTINSATLAVKLASIAKKLNGNKIGLLNQGTTKRLSSWGIGLGLSYNYAKVGSDPDDAGAVGAGGTGWSWGEGEYFSLPYLSAVIAK